MLTYLSAFQGLWHPRVGSRLTQGADFHNLLLCPSQVLRSGWLCPIFTDEHMALRDVEFYPESFTKSGLRPRSSDDKPSFFFHHPTSVRLGQERRDHWALAPMLSAEPDHMCLKVSVIC